KKLCLACKKESKGYGNCSEKSTKICSELAKTLGQIGIVYFSLKQYNTAIEYYQKAIKIYQKNNQREEQAKIMNYIGLACYKNSNVSYALWYHLKAFEIFEEIYEAQSNPNYLPHILSVYQRFNLSDQGVKLYRRVQELSRIMGTEVG
ncbi:MAG: tetratricopeptide repeat protein, partial [Cyanobacteriota bacterium]|nr:tetratricopeptide repeat protein [Cyanobacteriota bacterium]